MITRARESSCVKLVTTQNRTKKLTISGGTTNVNVVVVAVVIIITIRYNCTRWDEGGVDGVSTVGDGNGSAAGGGLPLEKPVC